MGTISVWSKHLVASYPEFLHGYGTELSGDDALLRQCIAGTTGAQAHLMTEPGPHAPLDGTTDYWEYSFAPTLPNIQVLWKTGFQWDEDAMKLALNALVNQS